MRALIIATAVLAASSALAATAPDHVAPVRVANSDPRTWSTCPTVDPKTIQDVCRLCAAPGNPPAFWWIKKGEACARH